MIVVNCRHLTQKTTGVQRFAEQIIRTLAKEREDLVFVAPRGFTPSESGYPVKAIGMLQGHAWEQIDLPRYLRKQGNPLLVNLMSTAPVFYPNKVMTAHDITYIRHPESFSRTFRALYALIVPPALRRSRNVITVSQFSRNEIAHQFSLDPSIFTVVHNAVDSRFSPQIELREQDRTPYFLAVSSPNRHKNFEAMIEAYRQSSLSPQFELKVVGEQNRSFADTSSDRRDVTGVSFTGRVSDSELISLYRGAFAFVFPSLYEGFGIPVLEAQACGSPVLSTNAASLPEVLADSALYFNPYDAADLANRMKEIVASASLRDELRARGLENVTRFSWELSAQKVGQLLDTLT